MSTSSNERGTPPAPPDRSTVILLLGDIADTTWRMFVPPILFIGLGFWADMSWGTKPWLSLAGIVIGIGITAALIRRQFQNVKRHDSK